MRYSNLLVSALITKTAVGCERLQNHCSSVSFHIASVADNDVFKTVINPENGTQIIEAVDGLFAGKTDYSVIGTKSAKADVSIAGIYCTPTDHHFHPEHKINTNLQVLVHGATLNGTYWSGLGYNKRYSWVKSALDHGHSTLTIDRLGHGFSSHPNAVSIVQEAFQIELLHQLFVQLKSKDSPYKHNQLIYVGHSYGSLLGNVLASKYPDDVDALVLTGWSSSLSIPLPAILNNWKTVLDNPGPDPINRKLPPGFLRPFNETARVESLFGEPGSFDPKIGHHEFVHADVQSIGEILSQGGGLVSNITKPVLVATGSDDKIFCPASQGPCQDQLDKTRSLFPMASRYDTYLALGSGHCLHLDYGSQKTFNFVQNWISSLTIAESNLREQKVLLQG